MDLGYRIGNFFIFLGLGLLLFFWITTQGDEPRPQINYLVFGLLSLIFGVWRAWQSRPKPQDVERFSALKKLFKKKEKK